MYVAFFKKWAPALLLLVTLAGCRGCKDPVSPKPAVPPRPVNWFAGVAEARLYDRGNNKFVPVKLHVPPADTLFRWGKNRPPKLEYHAPKGASVVIDDTLAFFGRPKADDSTKVGSISFLTADTSSGCSYGLYDDGRIGAVTFYGVDDTRLDYYDFYYPDRGFVTSARPHLRWFNKLGEPIADPLLKLRKAR